MCSDRQNNIGAWWSAGENKQTIKNQNYVNVWNWGNSWRWVCIYASACTGECGCVFVWVWAVSRWITVISLVACCCLMRSVTSPEHPHCINTLMHTDTHAHTHVDTTYALRVTSSLSVETRLQFLHIFFYCLFSVLQCLLRSWCGRGTRSQRRVALWPSSVALRETLRQLSSGKKRAAR